MELHTITDRNLFDSFVKNSPWNHYMKTSMWGEFKKKTENDTYEMLGFYEDGNLTGTAMVLCGKWMTHKYMYIPKGPCIDYQNPETVHEAFTLLRQYGSRAGIRFLRTDPNVVRVPHAVDGTVLDGFNNEFVTEEIKNTGFHHKGYGYGYDGSWTNRFTLMADISTDLKTVRSKYSTRLKRFIKKGKKFHISVRNGTKEDIDIILALQHQLVEQKGFRPSTYEYFSDICDAFGDHAKIYVAEMDLKKALGAAEDDVKLKEKGDNEKALKNALDTRNEIQELIAEYGDSMPASAGLFITFGEYCWCWYYYHHKKLNRFAPTDMLHDYAVEDCHNNGIRYYDLCGFSGLTNSDDAEFGLYDYKRQFGTEFIEQIGEFDYAYNEKAYQRFKTEKSLEVRLRHKLWHLTYRKKTN